MAPQKLSAIDGVVSWSALAIRVAFCHLNNTGTTHPIKSTRTTRIWKTCVYCNVPLCTEYGCGPNHTPKGVGILVAHGYTLKSGSLKKALWGFIFVSKWLERLCSCYKKKDVWPDPSGQCVHITLQHVGNLIVELVYLALGGSSHHVGDFYGHRASSATPSPCCPHMGLTRGKMMWLGLSCDVSVPDCNFGLLGPFAARVKAVYACSNLYLGTSCMYSRTGWKSRASSMPSFCILHLSRPPATL